MAPGSKALRSMDPGSLAPTSMAQQQQRLNTMFLLCEPWLKYVLRITESWLKYVMVESEKYVLNLLNYWEACRKWIKRLATYTQIIHASDKIRTQ